MLRSVPTKRMCPLDALVSFALAGIDLAAIARKQLWGNLSDPAREGFLGGAIPGEPAADTEGEEISSGGRDEDGKVIQPPPENFLLMLFDPDHVDYLRLTGDQYRQVDVRTGQSDWTATSVNP